MFIVRKNGSVERGFSCEPKGVEKGYLVVSCHQSARCITRRFLHVLLCLVFSTSVWQSGFAQETTSRFENFSHIPEMGKLAITSILQDSAGFIWIGSESGLYRFDGYEMRRYQHEPGNGNSVSANFIYSLFQDSHGDLWIGTFGGGLDKYDSKTGKFSHYQASETDENSLNSNYINAVAEDEQGNIWVATAQGLSKIERSTGKTMRFRAPGATADKLSQTAIATLLVDQDNHVWAGSIEGLFKVDAEAQSVVAFLSDKDYPDSIGNHSVLSLHQSSANKIWVGTEGGLYTLNTRTDTFDTVSGLDMPLAITAIRTDMQGNIWLGTNGQGLVSLSSDVEKTVQFRQRTGDATSLVSDYVTDILFDQSGGMWAATHEGLSKLNINSRAFVFHPHNLTIAGITKDKNVLAIFKDSSERLWIGTFHQGVYVYSASGLLEKHFVHDATNTNSITEGAISSITEDAAGHIWIATLGGGLNRYEWDSNQFLHFRHDAEDPNTINHNSVHVLASGGEGILWIGTFKGISQLNTHNLQTRRLQREPDGTDGPSDNNIMELFVDSDKRLWVGTQKSGLFRFDPQSQSFTPFSHSAEKPGTISNNFVTSITEDAQGEIWVATAGGGLNQFQAATGNFRYYRQEDGLNSDSVMSVVADDSGVLWLSSDSGLSRFEPENKQITHFTVDDGLQENDFYLRSVFKSQDGRLFFGGINGFNSFWPDAIVTDIQAPSVVFTDFLLFNRHVDVMAAEPDASTERARSAEKGGIRIRQPVHHLSDLTLTHSQSLFSFEFAASGEQNPRQVEYAWQLSGWDETWLQSNYQRRFATYSNIPAGQYRLNVKARLPHTDWGESTSIGLTIVPPWWKTRWAYGAYIVIASALIALLYWLTIKKRQAEFERKIAQRERLEVLNIAKAKDELLANISHEFRTPLTLIISPLENLLANQKLASEHDRFSQIKRNAQRILVMVEQLLNLAKLRDGGNNAKVVVNASSRARFILAAFRDLAQQRSICLRLNIAEDRDLYVNMVADAWEKILTNLTSNAFKYSANGTQIELTLLASEPDTLCLRVKDSGFGIAQKDQARIFERFVQIPNHQHDSLPSGVGIGLALVKELVVSHGGSIQVQSKLDEGSLFEVTLPLACVKDINSVSYSGPAMAAAQEYVTAEVLNLIPLKEETSAEAHLTDKGKPTVLVVEDNAEMRSFLTECFEGHYQCLTAKNGATGLSLAEEHLPDIVVSDVMMPGIDGYQFVKQLRKNEQTSHIPTILLTAKGDLQSRLQGWQAEADDYVTKPFHTEELLTRVANLLASRARLRKKFAAALSHQSPVELKESPQMSVADQAFLKSFEACISENYHQPELNRKLVASKLFITERQLNRKLSALVEHNFSNYLTKYRLRQSKKLLAQGRSVADVADAVGFNSANYFSRCFKDEFGVLPSAINKLTNEPENI